MTAPFNATGIDHVVFHVRDPEASTRFYVDVLGLKVHREYPGHVFLKCGEQLLGLFRAPPGDGFTVQPDMNPLALNVDQGTYESIRAHLEDAGLEISGRPGDDRCIYFSDPDGHRLQVNVPD